MVSDRMRGDLDEFGEGAFQDGGRVEWLGMLSRCMLMNREVTTDVKVKVKLKLRGFFFGSRKMRPGPCASVSPTFALAVQSFTKDSERGNDVDDDDDYYFANRLIYDLTIIIMEFAIRLQLWPCTDKGFFQGFLPSAHSVRRTSS